MVSSFNAVPESDLPFVAERLLERHPPSAAQRNEIQDILWSDANTPIIPKKYRREVARAIEFHSLFLDANEFDRLLDRLWVLSDPTTDFLSQMGAGWKRPTLREDIRRHVHLNADDWSTEHFFVVVGALDCSDKRFALFLEGLAGPEVRPDENSQRRFVELANEAIRNCGAELRETDGRDGYPCFTLVSIHGAADGRPKNLIFASPVKPDLRFRDAVNNDIEIVTNADKVLIYDRPIGIEGIRWIDLQTWWASTHGISDQKTAKATLYKRLLSSLPANSPPQRLLFESYFRRFGVAIPDLPALLPEVWLHWDPKTVYERGADALLRFRMDFLLLLPGGVRVVLEVDGKQHYSDRDGKALPSKYAEMVSADRDLKLAGYHVFRFGGTNSVRDRVSQLYSLIFCSSVSVLYSVQSYHPLLWPHPSRIPHAGNCAAFGQTLISQSISLTARICSATPRTQIRS